MRPMTPITREQLGDDPDAEVWKAQKASKISYEAGNREEAFSCKSEDLDFTGTAFRAMYRLHSYNSL